MKKVLIVDDDSGFVEIIKTALEGTYKIVVAENGKKGLELARQELPDLILLDIVMPDINGVEVLKILKGDKATEAIKVAIVTNFGQEDIIKNALTSGATDVLLKYNLGTGDFVNKVGELLHEPNNA